jgi:hypothetical protein
LAACLLASGVLLASAADSRAAVDSHRAWVVAWAGGGTVFFLASLRAAAGSLPGLSIISAPLWLLAGIAGAAVLGGHAIDVLAASPIPLDLDSAGLPQLRLGDSILLGALAAPALLVWYFEADRGGSPPLRLLSLAGFCLLGTVLLSVLLGGHVRPFEPTLPEPTFARAMALFPLGWVLAAFAFDAARSRALRLGGFVGILLGGAVGFVVLPVLTVMRRPSGLASLDDGGLFDLLVGRAMGTYGSEIAAGMEASLCALTASALLILCMRNAVYGWRALPGIVGLALPLAAVFAQARWPSDVVLNAALLLGWAAVIVGVPFTGRVGGHEE